MYEYASAQLTGLQIPLLKSALGTNIRALATHVDLAHCISSYVRLLSVVVMLKNAMIVCDFV